MEGNHNIWGLAENFRRICKKKGIKPFSLVKKGAIKGDIESIRDGRNTSIEGVYKVAKALGVTLDELITDKPLHIGIAEGVTEYGRTKEEQDYTEKLVKIMRTKMDGTVLAIKQNIDAFLTTPDKIEELKKTG